MGRPRAMLAKSGRYWTGEERVVEGHRAHRSTGAERHQHHRLAGLMDCVDQLVYVRVALVREIT